MKRIILPLLLALAGCLSMHGQSIDNIAVTVAVHPDGSALVTQEWDVNVVKGTEWYLPVKNLGAMEVKDLRVFENGKEFESVGTKWNTGWSLEEKRERCGINIVSDGIELCWGQGDLGRHRWTATFTLTGLVQTLNDADAFIFQFINPGLVAAPKNASVTIVNESGKKWSYDNTRVWGFGFDGDVNLVDGKVLAVASDGLRSNGHMTVMVRFNKGMFSPTISRSMDFAQMEYEAKQGSSYNNGEEDDPSSIITFILALLGAGGAVFYAIYAAICKALGYRYKKSYFGQTKITDWYRDAPLNGDLFAAYYVLHHGQRFGADPSDMSRFIGALFLSWVMDGKVKVIPDGKRVNLEFGGDHVFSGEVEGDLYLMAEEASGENLILEKGEFEKWSKRHYTEFTGWTTRADSQGKSNLYAANLLIGSSAMGPEAQAKLRQLIGFKNFLKDFTLVPEREVGEVRLCKSYLIYAQLFGVADKVSAQLQKLYPADMEQFARNYGMDTTTLTNTIFYSNAMSFGASRAAAAKIAAEGRGGHSSFGGGGGFSGGGFGGGSR